MEATGHSEDNRRAEIMNNETTTTYQTLAIVTSESTNDSGAAFASITRGKARKPYANYRFRSVERRDEFVANEKIAEDGRIASKAARAIETKAARAAFKKTIEVGTILHSSWGYDQTQCDFFQVIAVKGIRVTLRAIAGNVVPGSEGFDCCNLTPAPDEFTADEFKATIGSWGIKIHSSSTATVAEKGRSFYNSWYA